MNMTGAKITLTVIDHELHTESAHIAVSTQHDPWSNSTFMRDLVEEAYGLVCEKRRRKVND